MAVFAPRVCIDDLCRSAIIEFLRTSRARSVSRRIAMRLGSMGPVPLGAGPSAADVLFASCEVSFRKRFLKATSSVPIWRRGLLAFSRLKTVRRRAIRSEPLPESLS